jgi:hypothetical protein
MRGRYPGPLLTRLVDVEELREIGGEVVLVHNGNLLALNRVATQLWEMLAEPRTSDDLIETASRNWPGAPVARDVPRFLVHLGELGLVSEA